MVFLRSVRAGALAFVMCSVPAMAHAETLREALTSAYKNNPQILSALLNVKATAEGIVAAKSAKLPTIGATASVSGTYVAGAPSITPTATVGAQLSQTIFDNFKSDADIEAARALTEGSRYALQDAEQTVLLNVATAYFSVIRDTQLVQLASENVKFFQAQLDSANERLKIGEGTKLDVSQAQARAAQGTSDYQAALAALQISQATYERYVGHKPRDLTMTYRLGALLPSSLDKVLREAETSNPAILSAKALIRAAQANSDSANAAFGPTLNMIASINGQPVGGKVPEPSGTLTFNLSVPIYGGGRYGSAIRKSNLLQIKSEVDALTMRDTVQQEATTAWSNMTSAAASMTSADSAVSAGQLSLEGTVQERDVGQATTLDVLNAQSELITIRRSLITATAARAVAAFNVVAATGHLTAGDLGLNVEVKTGEDYIAKVEDVWAELRALD